MSETAASYLSTESIVSMADLSRVDIELILQTAQSMKEISKREIKKAPPLRGKTIINCFLEPSTRTRTSFEIAGKRLSADVINISGAASSLTKGESIRDMMHNLLAMRPDSLVIRTPFSGAAAQIAEWVDIPVINAGDGRHEHPSQSLLDLMTIAESGKSFHGLNISIIGDILNSRVARSNAIALKTLGANVTFCGPAPLLPNHIHPLSDRVTYNLRDAVEGADVVMALRIQEERIDQAKFPSTREYSRLFGLNARVMNHAKEGAIVMHPGPINRGVEISPDVADGSRSLILNQVENGVAIRMALLYLLLGGSKKEQ